MAWIESHEEIGDHKKTHHLATHLGCSVPTAVGYLHLLWHYTLKVAWKDGDLSEFPPPVIARACWFDGDPFTFIDALKASGYITESLGVHEWKEYAKHIIYQRKYNETKRKKTAKSLQDACKNDVVKPKTSSLPNLTIPNQTIKTTTKNVRAPFQKPTADEVSAYAKSIGFDLDGQKFCDYYEKGGWVYGRGRIPIKDWKACVRTWKQNGFDSNGNTGGFQNGTKRDDGFATAKPGKYPD